MTNENKTRFDLEDRTARFGEDCIDFLKSVPKNHITTPIVTQLIRSGTSVGANYCEADCVESKKDFIHKLGICNKEAKESRHWLRMISRASPEHADAARRLWKEASELNLIFISIISKTRDNIGD